MVCCFLEIICLTFRVYLIYLSVAQIYTSYRLLGDMVFNNIYRSKAYVPVGLLNTKYGEDWVHKMESRSKILVITFSFFF